MYLKGVNPYTAKHNYNRFLFCFIIVITRLNHCHLGMECVFNPYTAA